MIPAELMAQIRRIQIRTSRMVNEIMGGQYESVFKGQGMEFKEVREYIPGDDIRSIDWNVTARTGHPHVKLLVVRKREPVQERGRGGIVRGAGVFRHQEQRQSRTDDFHGSGGAVCAA
jgi:hypothetical protein